MEGQRHATQYADNNRPQHTHSFEQPQMAAASNGSTHLPRRPFGGRSDGPDGMASIVAGSKRTAAMNSSTGRAQNGARVIDSKTLMDGERTIQINHEGQEYTLRLTRLGKLLLTK